MKKLRIKKEYGTWYYKKITPAMDQWLNGTIYELYDENGNLEYTCTLFSSLKGYIESGRKEQE